MPDVQVDPSSPEAFIRSVTPAALYISQQTGIPAEAMIAMAANETGYGKYALGNNLFGIKGSGPAGSNSSRTWEDYGQGPVNITDSFRAYHNATESFQDFVQFLRDNPRYGNVMQAVDQGGISLTDFVQGLKNAGYMTDPNYVGKMQNIANQWGKTIGDVRGTFAQPAQDVGTAAVNTAQDAARSIAARTSQFGMGLSSGDALAFCGPAAAMAFAQTYGRNPTVAEARNLAQKVGWNQQKGMAGIGSEQDLLRGLGVETTMTQGVDWNGVAGQVQGGNPVIISTPGHYYYIDGYNTANGQFHVGTSGTDLRGGSEFMTAQQIVRMPQSQGAPDGALYIAHPAASQPGGGNEMGAGQEGPQIPGIPGFFQPEARSVGDISSALGTFGQGALGAVQALPGNIAQVVPQAVQTAQQIPGAVQQTAQTAAQGIRDAVQQTAQETVQGAQQGIQQAAQHPLETALDVTANANAPIISQVAQAAQAAPQALQTAQDIKEHPENIVAGLPEPNMPQLSPQDQAALRHEPPPRRTLEDVQQNGPSPPLSPIVSEAIGQPHGQAAGGIRQGDLGSLARATLLDPVFGEMPGVDHIRQLAGIQDPFTGWREQLRKGEQGAVIPEGIRTAPLLGGITEQMFDPTFPMMAFGRVGAMTGVLDAAWGMDPVASLTAKGAFAGGGKILGALQLGQLAGRLPAPGWLLGSAAIKATQLLRWPADRAYDAAFQAATGGLTRGLNMDVLGLVGHRLENAMPGFQTGRVMADLSHWTGSVAARTRASDILSLGSKMERLSGQQLRDEMLNYAAPDVVDAVLRMHGMDALTTRYIDASAAINSAAAKILPEVARNSVNLPLGAIGGHVLASMWPDDNDPTTRDHRILGGTLVGLLAMGGNPYASVRVSKTIAPAVLNTWRDLTNPIANLKNDVAPILMAWVARRNEVGFEREKLQQLIRDNWGGDKHAEDVAKTLEKTGSLPPLWQSTGGQEAVDMVRNSNDEIIARNLTRGADATRKTPTLDPTLYPDAAYQANLYLTHAVESDWIAARKAASVGKTPSQLWAEQAGSPDSYGLGSRFNTISHMTPQREWANFREGEANKVKYVYEGLDRRTADQYANQQHVVNNYNLAAQLDGAIQDVRSIPPGKTALDYSVIRAHSGLDVPPGFVPAKSLGIGQILNQDDVYINKPLASILNRAFKDKGIEEVGVFGPLLKKALEINSFAKEAVLGGDIFHMFAQVNQFLASNGAAAGMGQMGKIAATTLNSSYFKDAFVKNNEPEIREFIRQGGTWNMIPELRTHDWGLRAGVGIASSIGAGLGTYQTAKAFGKSDDDARSAAMVSTLLAGGLNFPLGMLRPAAQREWSTLITHFSDVLFHRTIPTMKLLTWQMHGMTPDAAKFANNLYGGYNLNHMLQSRELTDLSRLSILAPDWTGGFARNLRDAFFDPGSIGSLSRAYWASAAMNSVALIEGLNWGLAGHGSWENMPGNEGTVDLSPFFDQHGWDRRNPSTGEKEPVYWDVLPQFRALLDPFRESARWGLAALAQTDMGKNTPLNTPGIVGGMRPDQPAPPSGRSVLDAWGRYASGRIGLVPGAVSDLFATEDYAGRPVNRADDDYYAMAMNSIKRQMERLAPASIQTFGQSSESGVPGPLALTSGIFGQRLRTPSVYSEAQKKRMGVVAEFTGKSASQYQKEYQTHITRKNDAYDMIDRVHAGLNADTGKPDPALATPADRLKAASAIHRPTLPEFERGLMSDEMRQAHPEFLDQYMADLQELDAVKGQSAGQDPADFNPAGAGVDADSLFNEIWNRQPTDLQNAKDDTSRARLRRQWLTNASINHNIDHGVLEDFVKARLANIDLNQYKLPGMTSQDLDLILNAWQQAGARYPDDPITARQMQQQELGKYAKAFGQDPLVLQERIHLRSIAPREQTPETQAYTRAVATLESAHDINTSPQYIDENGNPMGSPNDWDSFNKQLSAVDNWDRFRGHYKDPGLQRLADARQRGSANSARLAYLSPGYWDYEHWFGMGKRMTDDQWAKFRAGTLDMWYDKPTPEEAQNRNNVIALYQTLNTPDPNDPRHARTLAMSAHVPHISFFGRTRTDMNLAAAVQGLNKIRSNAWKDDSLKLDQNITDANAPAQADMGQVSVP